MRSAAESKATVAAKDRAKAEFGHVGSQNELKHLRKEAAHGIETFSK